MDGVVDQRTKSVILLVITALLWSFGGILIKLVKWNPVAIAGMRSAIAAVIMLIYVKKPKINWSRPQIGGAVSYAATVILFVVANKLTTSANAILLQYTAPIYVALFGTWLLNEKPTKLDWITIFFVLAGMGLFFVDKMTGGNILGNIIAIISGVAFAFTAIFMRMQKNGSPIESVLLGNILTAVISVPFMFQSMPDISSWTGLVLLGVFQLGISYILYSTAMKSVSALEGTIIPILEPILNPVWVFIFAGETPGIWSLLGGFIVIFFITLRCVILIKRPQLQSQHK